MNAGEILETGSIVKVLIIAQTFIRIIIFRKEGGGRLLEATLFWNCKKNFKIFKFS